MFDFCSFVIHFVDFLVLFNQLALHNWRQWHLAQGNFIRLGYET